MSFIFNQILIFQKLLAGGEHELSQNQKRLENQIGLFWMTDLMKVVINFKKDFIRSKGE